MVMDQVTTIVVDKKLNTLHLYVNQDHLENGQIMQVRASLIQLLDSCEQTGVLFKLMQLLLRKFDLYGEHDVLEQRQLLDLLLSRFVQDPLGGPVIEVLLIKYPGLLDRIYWILGTLSGI